MKKAISILMCTILMGSGTVTEVLRNGKTQLHIAQAMGSGSTDSDPAFCTVLTYPENDYSQGLEEQDRGLEDKVRAYLLSEDEGQSPEEARVEPLEVDLDAGVWDDECIDNAGTSEQAVESEPVQEAFSEEISEYVPSDSISEEDYVSEYVPEECSEAEAKREKRRAYHQTYYAAHQEEENARFRAYYAAHREERTAKQRAYNAAHREEINAKQRAYNAAHREEIKAKQRAYNATHGEERRARDRAYRAKHKDEINARQRQRRAERKAAVNKSEVTITE